MENCKECTKMAICFLSAIMRTFYSYQLNQFVNEIFLLLV